MQSLPLVRHVLSDDGLTRGLGDIEARMIVEWLVERAEEIADDARDDEAGWRTFRAASRRARAVSRFVCLWAEDDSRGAAAQLAASERLDWPLPTGPEDAGDLMGRILGYEARRAA